MATNHNINLLEQRYNQALVNIGVIGHVSHGKTTLVKKLSQKDTRSYTQEVMTGRTIKLGYANIKIYQCQVCNHLFSQPSQRDKKTEEKLQQCEKCKSTSIYLHRHVSFVDCPGHHSFMRCMMNGSAVMDTFILVIASNEPCPSPQTQQHLMIAEMCGIKPLAVIQNKIDLVSTEALNVNYQQIKDFVRDTCCEDVPIIPISAQYDFNISVILKLLTTVEERSLDMINFPSKFTTIRSFDPNKPGTKIENIQGGIIGGSIISGSFRVGDKIEINPGILVSEHGFKKYEPVITTILSIRSENKDLDTGLPGGLIALGLNIDPCLTKDDRFVGQLVKRANDTNIVATNSITMKCQFFKTETKKSSKGLVKVGETLRLNVLSLTVDTKVTLVKKSRIRVESDIPIFVEDQQRISISKQDGENFNLLGLGLVEREEMVPVFDFTTPKKKKLKIVGETMEQKFEPTNFEYQVLLDLIQPELRSLRSTHKIELPFPTAAMVGRKRTAFTNAETICMKLNRPLEHFKDFVSSEVMAICSIDTNQFIIIQGKLDTNALSKLIRNYVREFVVCVACKSMNTSLSKISTFKSVKCDQCSHNRALNV